MEKRISKALLMTALITSSLLVSSVTAFAEESLNEYSLDTMVVTATRTEKVLSEIPASVSVVTDKDIEKMHVNTINEVLSRVPGIYSSRLKGIANSSPTILMRGLNNQAQNLVLVDGQPLNDASSAVVGWSDIPVDSVARIEVVKGTASALYGSQAMGGVVNIITKNPSKGERKVSVGYGSNATWIKRASIGDKINDKLGFRIAYEGRETHGFVNKFVNTDPKSKKPSGTIIDENSISGLIKTETNTGKSTYRTGTVGRNHFDEDNIHSKFVYNFTDSKELSFSFTHHKDEYGYDYTVFNNYIRYNNQPYKGNIKLENGQYLTIDDSKYTGTPGGKTQNIYALNYNDKDNDIKISLGLLDTKHNWSGWISPVNGKGTKSDTPNKRWNFNIQKSVDLTNKDEMVFGLQYTKDSMHKTEHNLVNGELNKQSKGNTRSYGLYIQNDHKFDNKWSILSGIRYDNWKVYDSWMQLDKDKSKTIYYPARSDSSFSPKIALQYKIDDESNLFTSWGKAFAAPTLQKMFSGSASSASYTEANPNLNPQTVKTVEIGYKKKFGESTILGVTYYHNDINDLLYTRKTGLGKITYTVNGSTYTKDKQRVENAGTATTNGIELDLNHKINDRWSMFANYMYQQSKIDKCSTNGAAEGKIMTYVPKHVFNLGVDYSAGKWNSELVGSYQSKMYAQDNNSDTAKGVYTAYDPYFVVDFNLTYSMDKNSSISFAVNNLFDKEYYSYNLCEGRNYMLTVGYNF